MDAVAQLGHTILDIAHRTADQDGIGCARFVVFANAVEDTTTNPGEERSHVGRRQITIVTIGDSITKAK